MLQHIFSTTMTTEAITRQTILQRIQDLKNVSTAANNGIHDARQELIALKEQGDLHYVVDRVVATLDKVADNIDVLQSFYQKQISVLSNNQTVEQEVSQPEVPQAAPVIPEEEKMTQVEGPRPGSAAWRIQQRLLREQGIADTPAPVPVPAPAAAPAPTPVPMPAPAQAPVPEVPRAESRTRAVRRPDATQRAEMNQRAAALAASIAVPAPEEDKGCLLPSVVEDEPAPAIPTLQTPPNMYQRMTTPKYSPLWRAFAASPWFPEGTGLISIGQKKWPEITKDLTQLNGRQLISCAQGFYIHPGDEMPSKVLIRLRTFAVLWDFKNEEDSIKVFQIGLSDKGTNDYAWFNLGAITSGSIGRLIAELNTYLGTENVPFNPIG